MSNHFFFFWLRFAPSHGAAQLDGGGDPLPVELGARFRLLEHLVLAHLAACMEHFAPFRLELQSRPDRHARLSSFRQWLRGNSWARLELLRASSPVLGSRRGADGSHRTQTVRAARRWLPHKQCLTSVLWWEVCDVSHDPSCSQNGDLDEAKERFVWRCKFFSSWSDIILSA